MLTYHPILYVSVCINKSSNINLPVHSNFIPYYHFRSQTYFTQQCPSLISSYLIWGQPYLSCKGYVEMDPLLSRDFQRQRKAISCDKEVTQHSEMCQASTQSCWTESLSHKCLSDSLLQGLNSQSGLACRTRGFVTVLHVSKTGHLSFFFFFFTIIIIIWFWETYIDSTVIK